MPTSLWQPTDADLFDGRVPRRADTFRFELLDREGTPIGEVYPDLGRNPRLVNNTSRRITRSLENLQLPASDMAQINTLSDRLRVTGILQNGSTFPLGTLLWADDSKPLRSWGQEHRSTLIDRMFLVDQPTGMTLGWGRGAGVGIIVAGILLPVLPADDLDFSAFDAISLGAPVAWDASATRWQVVADIMKMIGFLPPYFDNNDRLVLRATPDPNVTAALLRYDHGDRIWTDSIVETDDSLDAANRFIVTDTSGSKGPITGTFDVGDATPHSKANRGFHVVHVETMQGLASVAQAKAAARSLAISHRASNFRWVEFSSALDFRHDSWDVLNVLGDQVLETSWSMELRSGGEMKHEARAVYF